MAASSLTSANVKASASATKFRAPAGAAINAGQTVYIDSSGLAQLGVVSAAGNVPVGIANNSAAVGQAVEIVFNDPAFTHGLTGVVAGNTLWAHPTAGAITVSDADNAAGNFTTLLGIAISATQAKIFPLTSGVAHA